MSNTHGLTIYAKDENIKEAEFMSRSFVEPETGNRAYINTLGAEVITEYLKFAGIDVSEVHNLHSLSKILERFDISDIMLPNIHIDVRVIFDKKYVFVPKSHFEYGIAPDVYAAVVFSPDYKSAEFLGWFTASAIDKRKCNADYYFVETDKISSPAEFVGFVKGYSRAASAELTENDFLRGRELSVALADHNIGHYELVELLKLLTASDALRESVLEFDNFEKLSYNAAPGLSEISFVSSVEKNAEEEADVNTDNDNGTSDVAVVGEDETDSWMSDLDFDGEEISPVDTSVNSDADNGTGSGIVAAGAAAAVAGAVLGEALETPVAAEVGADILEAISGFELAKSAANTEDTETPVVDEVLQTGAEDVVEVPAIENAAEDSGVIDSDNLAEFFAEEVSEPDSSVVSSSGEESLMTVDEAGTLISETPMMSVDEVGTALYDDSMMTVDDAGTSVYEEPLMTVDELGTSVGEETLATVEEELLPLDEEPLMSVDETVLPLEEPEFLNADIEASQNIDAEDELNIGADSGDDSLSESPEFEEATAAESFDISEEDVLSSEDLEIGNVSDELISDEENDVPTLTEETDISDMFGETSDEIADISEDIIPLSDETDIADMFDVTDESDIAEDVSALSEETDILNLFDENFEETTENVSASSADFDAAEPLPEEITEISEELLSEVPLEEEVSVEAPEAVEVNENPASETDSNSVLEKPTTLEDPELLADALLDNVISSIDKGDGNDGTSNSGFSPEMVSDSAIKLASVSGEASSEDTKFGVHGSDSEKVFNNNVRGGADEIPEHIKAMEGLAGAKKAANLEAERSGIYGKPTDMSALSSVETRVEEAFEHETFDMEEMSSVQLEDFKPDDSAVIDIGNLPEQENLMYREDEFDNYSTEEINGVDLPDVNAYSLTEDGNLEGNPGAAIYDKDPNADISELTDIDSAKGLNGFGEDDDEGLMLDAILPDDSDNIVDLTGDDVVTVEETEEKSDFISEDMPAATTSDETSGAEVSFGDFETADVSDLFGDADIADFVSDNSEEIGLSSAGVDNAVPAGDDISNSEWMQDTTYDNLEDVPNEPVQSVEEIITEPEIPEQKSFAAVDNSRVISDRSFTPGEIPIDINYMTDVLPEGPDGLSSLYTGESNVIDGAIPQNPGRLMMEQPRRSGGLGVVLGLLGTLITLALVGVIGFNVMKMIKPPVEETPQPITDDAVPTTSDLGVSEQNTLDVNPDNVVNMDNTTDALSNVSKPVSAQTHTPTVNNTQVSKKMPANVFLEVQRLTWEVPDYVSYNQDFKRYFQSAGKSLKLSLNGDLLLATEYVYSNEIKVGITFNKDGSLKNAQIVSSSGSSQVDKIVLQTVNQTLNALKAPRSIGEDESTTVILKIYL